MSEHQYILMATERPAVLVRLEEPLETRSDVLNAMVCELLGDGYAFFDLTRKEEGPGEWYLADGNRGLSLFPAGTSYTDIGNFFRFDGPYAALVDYDGRELSHVVVYSEPDMHHYPRKIYL